MGVVGSAKLLQALARDNLVPGLSTFSQGTEAADEPVYAIIFTYVVAQATMLFDINKIASFVTMTYLVGFPSRTIEDKGWSLGPEKDTFADDK
jgi:solute carrier family 12 (potassium/chloride transporters), member 9